jgi:hypothetical protein
MRQAPRLCHRPEDDAAGCVLDELSKGKPLGQTYFALFCATWDNGFVRLGRSTDLPYASGFTGARGIRGWQERMKLLESFGVEIKASGDQKSGWPSCPIPISCSSICGRRRRQGKGPYDPLGLGGLLHDERLLERAIDVGANDDSPTPRSTPPNARQTRPGQPA